MTTPGGPPDDPLLTAALQVLAERGLKGATTRAIAERAGVNEVTLFRRHGTKLALLRAAVLSRTTVLAGRGVHYTGNLEADLIHLTREYGEAPRSSERATESKQPIDRATDAATASPTGSATPSPADGN